MRRWWAAFVAAAALLPGCGDDECGSCTDLFQVQLGAERFEAGVWRVIVDADGARAICEVELPLRENRRVPSCTAAFVDLSLGPDDTPDTLTVLGNPAQVEVVVELDGAEVGRRAFEPDYEGVTPGEGCEIACSQAFSTLQIRSGSF